MTDTIDLEAELATATARVRLGTQQALKHIVSQYRSEDVQRPLKKRLQQQLINAASRGEDCLRICDADFDKVSRMNVPDKQCKKNPYYDSHAERWITPSPKHYNSDCLSYGQFLHPQQVMGHIRGYKPAQPEWACKLYESVKLNEELVALSTIAESLSVDLRVEYHDMCEYVFDWAKCAANSYYNTVKGPVDVFTQYELTQDFV